MKHLSKILLLLLLCVPSGLQLQAQVGVFYRPHAEFDTLRTKTILIFPDGTTTGTASADSSVFSTIYRTYNGVTSTYMPILSGNRYVNSPIYNLNGKTYINGLGAGDVNTYGAWIGQTWQGMYFNPGQSRTGGSFYVNDASTEATVTPHSLFEVDRWGPSSYSGADQIAASWVQFHHNGARSNQPQRIGGLYGSVSVGEVFGAYVPSGFGYGLYGQAVNKGSGTVPALYGVVGEAIHYSWPPASTMTGRTERAVSFMANPIINMGNSNGTIGEAFGIYLPDNTIGDVENSAIRMETTGKISWNKDVSLARSGIGALTLSGKLTADTVRTNTFKVYDPTLPGYRDLFQYDGTHSAVVGSIGSLLFYDNNITNKDTGGAVVIQSFEGNSNGSIRGGEVSISAGASHGAGTGGDVVVYAGSNSATGNGGAVIIQSGTSAGASGNGGDISLLAGITSNGNGGNIGLTAGMTTNGSAGNVSITAGDPNGTVYLTGSTISLNTSPVVGGDTLATKAYARSVGGADTTWLHNNLVNMKVGNPLRVDSVGIVRLGAEGGADIEVFDVNGNGYLEELRKALVFARSFYPYRVTIHCVGGTYLMDTSLVMTYQNSYTSIYGNGTGLTYRNNYTGQFLSIIDAGGHGINGIRIYDFITDENGRASLYDGIKVTLGFGSYMQMCAFDRLKFVYPRNAIGAYLPMKAGFGDAAWMNANWFTRFEVSSCVRFVKITSDTIGAEFNGNTFTNNQIQFTDVSVVGVDTLQGSMNEFNSCVYWDAAARPLHPMGYIFGKRASENRVSGGDVGAWGCLDLAPKSNRNIVSDAAYSVAMNNNRGSRDVYVDSTLTADSISTRAIAVSSIDIENSSNGGRGAITVQNTSSTADSKGIYAQAWGNNGSNTYYGVYGLANGGGYTNIGVYGLAANGTNNYGVYSYGDAKVVGNLSVTGGISQAGVYDVRSYGAIADSSTDCTIPFRLASSAAGEFGTVVIPPGAYILTDSVQFMGNLSAIGARIHVSDTTKTYIVIGDYASSGVLPQTIYAPQMYQRVHTNGAGWGSDVAIKCVNQQYSFITVPFVSQFGVALKMVASTGKSTIFTQTTIGELYNNKVGIMYEPLGTGWINDNLTTGGTIAVEAANGTNVAGCFGIYLKDAEEGPSQNTFRKIGLEADVFQYAVNIYGEGNIIDECRFEAVTPKVAVWKYNGNSQEGKNNIFRGVYSHLLNLYGDELSMSLTTFEGPSFNAYGQYTEGAQTPRAMFNFQNRAGGNLPVLKVWEQYWDRNRIGTDWQFSLSADTLKGKASGDAITTKRWSIDNTTGNIMTSGSIKAVNGVIAGAPSAIADSVIDWSAAPTFTKTIGAAQRLVFSNLVEGQVINVVITSSGSYSVTWVSTVSWPDGGTVPTQTASGKDIYTFMRVGGVTYGAVRQNFN